MPKRSITPTKSNYSLLKDELKLAQEGHSLLEQKREVLVANLSSLAVVIREKRELLDSKLFKIFNQLALVRLETDGFNLDLITNNTKQDYEVQVLPYSIMGIVAPKLLFIAPKITTKSSVPMGISGTSPTFDKLVQLTKGVQELVAEVAYLETTAWRVAREIRNTQRRINALENFVIPDTSETMKFIKNILEEKDRETLFQIKRVKEKNRKKKALKKETIYDV